MAAGFGVGSYPGSPSIAEQHAELEGAVSHYSALVVPDFRERAVSNDWALNEARETCRVYGLSLDSFDSINGAICAASSLPARNLEFISNAPSSSVRGNTRIKLQGEGPIEFFLLEYSQSQSPFALSTEGRIQQHLRLLQALSLVGVIDPQEPSADALIGILGTVDPALQSIRHDSQIHLMSVVRSVESQDHTLFDLNLNQSAQGSLVSVGVIGPGDDGRLHQRGLEVESQILSTVDRAKTYLTELTKAVIRGDADSIFSLALTY